VSIIDHHHGPHMLGVSVLYSRRIPRDYPEESAMKRCPQISYTKFADRGTRVGQTCVQTYEPRKLVEPIAFVLRKREEAYDYREIASKLRFSLHASTMLPLSCRPRDNPLQVLFVVVHRQKISSEESSITEVMAWYTSVNAAMLDHLTNQIKETDNSGVWR